MDAELIVADAAAWRAWLDDFEHESDGVWLVLAKKGTVTPTSLGYDQALVEALCSGWIDGQKKGRDAATFLQRFTPRRARSLWSQRNVGLVAELIAQERMRPRGQTEIERAQADGRWERAYAGAATAVAPDDLLAALAASPDALARFEALTGSERYSALWPVLTASGAARERRIAALVARLSA